MMIGMGKTRSKPKAPSSSREILTDAKGHATQVVMTVEEYEQRLEHLEDAQDIQEAEKRLENPELVSFEEVKASLGQ